MYIGERSEHPNPWWTLSDLADKVQRDQDATRRKMAYWVNQGVVRVSTDALGQTTYAGVDNLAEDQLQVNAESMDDDLVDQTVSADAQLEQEMKVYEDFVRGMLNNYESLPLDRIHNMLKMFVSTGEHKYEKTIEQLGTFLNTLVANESFGLSSAGEYFINKKK
jgi:anaphase-promoting complex subunit 2